MPTTAQNVLITEKELLARAKTGDDLAFAALVEKYQPRIYNIGLRMLGKNEDALDMTQEALIKIYRYLDSFRGDSSFSTWVYRISVNCCKDILRTAYYNRELAFSGFGDDDTPETNYDVADLTMIPEEVVMANEQHQYLLALIASLNPKYRIVVVLREVSGLSYQEIAESVGISIGTVKSRLSRARATLIEKISTDGEQYPHLVGLISNNAIIVEQKQKGAIE